MSTALSLYAITDEYQALLNSLAMCGTPEQTAECEAEIERAGFVLARKVDNFSRYLAHLQSQIELAANEIDRLETRRNKLISAQDRLEQYAVKVMQQMHLKKLDGETSQLSLRQNASAVEITDLSQIPGEFKTVEPKVVVTPDRRAIKKAIQSGRDVPGADLRFGTVSLVRK